MKTTMPVEVRLIHAQEKISDAPLVISGATAAAYNQIMTDLGASRDLLGTARVTIAADVLVHELGRVYASGEAALERELRRAFPEESPLLRRREFDAYLALLRAGADECGVDIRPTAKRSNR